MRGHTRRALGATTLFALATVSGLVARSQTAYAQTRAEPARRSTLAPRRAPSFRVGAGMHGGYSRMGVGAAAAWLLAGYVHAGVQLSDLFALDAQLSGGWIALAYYVRTHVYADFTFASRVALAIGPMWGQGAFGEASGSMAGASAKLTVFPVSERLESGVRFGLAISVEADVGVSLSEGCYCAPPFVPRGGNAAWGVYAGLGFMRF